MLTCPSCMHENPDGQKFCGECGTKLEAPPEREERKVITALFCDLVGSTALGERLDAEDISRLLRKYQAICRKRIESHGGVVEKFIGDAVVGVFGVPAAHEDDPERAVRAALRIIEDLTASDLQIEVRIGVNTGEALVRLDVDPRSGEGFATGDTMNTAARLEAAAPVMGVAVGERTQRASAGAITYEELPPVMAKGKAEPVRVWRAVRPIARVGTLARDETPFVGRDVEFSLLVQLFERSRTRPATEFVTIVGEPGLGKSRLVRELARHVDRVSEPVIWREGRCLPYGDGIGFWALGEIVKAQAGILETDDQTTIASKLDDVIAERDPQIRTWLMDRLAPLVGLATETAPPQQDEAFTAWRGFLEGIAAKGPTVLVIEDLHWADEGFVAFLEHVAKRTAGLPLLVAATARPEVEERHPSWPPGRRSTVLSLAPLGAADVQTLIRAVLPEASQDVGRVVVERSGGSPLYAEQLAAMMREDATSSNGGLDSAMIPSSVQALIAARIDGLEAEPKRVLMEAAVVGTTFWSGALAAVGSHDGLEASLGELVRREFCRAVTPTTMEGDQEFAFWHTLVRDVAYAELTKSERARAHATVARWLTDRTHGAVGDQAEIVLHHAEAALGMGAARLGADTEEMSHLRTEALLAAGIGAMRTDVPRALEFLRRALADLPEDDDRRPATTQRLGEALIASGSFEEARPLLENAFSERLAAGDDVAAVRLVDELELVHQALGDMPASDPLIAELRARLGDAPSPALANLLAIQANYESAYGRGENGIALARRSLAMTEQLGLAPLPMALVELGGDRIRKGDRGGRVDIQRAVDMLLDEGRISQAVTALCNSAFAEPHVDDALETCDRAIALATKVGAEAVRWGSRAERLHFLASRGRFDEIIREADPIAAWSLEFNDEFTRASVLLGLARSETYHGGSTVDIDELVALIEATHPNVFVLGDVALLAQARGDLEQARGLIVRAARAGSDESHTLLAEMAAELGLLDLATELLAKAPEPSTDEAHRVVAVATVTDAAGDPRAAARGYEDSVARFAERGQELWRARTLQKWGDCLLRLEDRDGGIERLREARTAWEGMGANARIEQIDQILAQAQPRTVD